MTVGAGLVLALLSAFALNWGWLEQHGAAQAMPPLSVRRPLWSLRLLFADRSWLVGFVIGRNADGEPEGFLHFAVSQPGSALSLSSMPRLRTTPNGFNEWLICQAIAWGRFNGIERVSLNFAPFAALLAPEADLTGLQEVQRRALLTLKGHFQLDNLLAFNRKFFPRWERRFVVYERRRDLPRVGIAALAAEAYLPFQNERK